MNNSRILTIKNAKHSEYYLYMNLYIWGDFQICISVPLRVYFKHKAAGSEGPESKMQTANPERIISATENVKRAGIEMVIDEFKKSTAWKNHYSNI